MCAIDWILISNEGMDAFKNALAVAAGTTPHRVTVNVLHQHDAPVVDLGAQRLLDEVGLINQLCDPQFHEALKAFRAQQTESVLENPDPREILGELP